jgi:hypothetical protein
MGDLVVWVEPSGRADAVLTLRDRSEIKATGQVNGQAINLIFVVRPDTYIVGGGDLATPYSRVRRGLGWPLCGSGVGRYRRLVRYKYQTSVVMTESVKYWGEALSGTLRYPQGMTTSPTKNLRGQELMWVSR